MENEKIKINEDDLFYIIISHLMPYIESIYIYPNEALSVCDGVINAIKLNDTKIINISIQEIENLVSKNLNDLNLFEKNKIDELTLLIINEVKVSVK